MAMFVFGAVIVWREESNAVYVYLFFLVGILSKSGVGGFGVVGKAGCGGVVVVVLSENGKPCPTL